MQSANNAHAFGQYNHLFTERFFGYFRTDALHDEIADLQYRVTLSPGVGYYFVKQTNTTWPVNSVRPWFFSGWAMRMTIM